jgi:phosphoglycerate dehydrogenase-like enzyme
MDGSTIKKAGPALKTLYWTADSQAAERLDEAGAARWTELRAEPILPGADAARLAEADIIVVQGAALAAEAMEAAPRCRAIIHAGNGAAGLDLERARRLGIMVASVPEGGAFAWAASVRCELERFAAAWKHGEFGAVAGGMPRRPRVALVGLGAVGRAIAKEAHELKLDVCAHDPFALDESFEQAAVRRIPMLHDALGMADMVSLQVSPAETNRGLLGEAEIGLMRRGGWLASAGWSEAVDADAAEAALRAGRLARVVIAERREENRAGGEGIRWVDPTAGCGEEIARRGLEEALRLAAMLARGEALPHLLIDPPLPREGD